MGVYDQTARYLVKQGPMEFFSWQTPELLKDYAFQGFEDTRTVAFPGEPDRTCDTVARFVPRQAGSEPLLVDVEFEAEPTEDMLERTGEYAYRLRHEKRPDSENRSKYQVIPLIVYLTGLAVTDSLDMRVASLGDAGIYQRTPLVLLQEWEGAALLRRIERGELSRLVLPWLALMRGMEDATMVTLWRGQAEQEPDAALRADLGKAALFFAERAGRRARWQEGLEGFNVEHSPLLQEFENRALLRGRREDIVQVLQTRFPGGPVPAEIKVHLGSLTDPEELTRLLREAARCDSLAAFGATAGLDAG